MLRHHSLSDEIVEKVLLELPEQPWPVRIHQQVAQKLGVKDIVVSNAISYLIYTGKVHAQVFGYVFDGEDNIVAEGEHFGHTEKEARENLKEQRSFQERKFGF